MEALTPQPDPQEVHRFLASFPRRLRELGRPERYQMIVTANYDSALEQAFDDEGEDDDLAVFLAAGTDQDGTNRGRSFTCDPSRASPSRSVTIPAAIRGFQIDRFDQLARTLIVRSTVQPRAGRQVRAGTANYVLTEDQYIDYLVNDQIVRLVPAPDPQQAQAQPFPVPRLRDPRLEPGVFLKRAWQGNQLKTTLGDRSGAGGVERGVESAPGRASPAWARRIRRGARLMDARQSGSSETWSQPPRPLEGGFCGRRHVGLRLDTEADANWFFGRDDETQTIIGNLTATRLTILYAKSGVGKELVAPSRRRPSGPRDRGAADRARLHRLRAVRLQRLERRLRRRPDRRDRSRSGSRVSPATVRRSLATFGAQSPRRLQQLTRSCS